MTKPCVVPGCKTGSHNDKSRRSVFLVPKDAERRKKWESAISVNLKITHAVCEKHFEDKYILREWVKEASDGEIIAKVQYKHPRLSNLAVPMIFVDDSTNSESAECSRVSTESSNTPLAKSPPSAPSPQLDCAAVVKTQAPHSPAATEVVYDLSVEHNYFRNVAMQVDTCNGCEENTKMTDILSSVFGDKWPSAMEIVDNDSTTSIKTISRKSLAVRNANAPAVVSSSTTSNQHMQAATAGATTDHQYTSMIPKTWNFAQLRSGKERRDVFSFLETKIDNGVHIPINQRCVTLDAAKNLEYLIYGRRVDTQGTQLDRILNTAESLPNLLKRFEQMKICSGAGDLKSQYVPIDCAFRDYVQQWRHNECSMLSKKKRCGACLKLRKRILQQMKRMQKDRKLHRLLAQKLAVMRKKNYCDNRRANRSEQRVKILRNLLKEKQDQMAEIQMSQVHDMNDVQNINGVQKIVLKEILAAAGRKDVKGRRYTKEWLMLCMLMNIRSHSTYEFLRKNNILPLPSMRTIHSYRGPRSHSQIKKHLSFAERKASFDQ